MRLPPSGPIWADDADGGSTTTRAGVHLPSTSDVVVVGAGIAGLTTAYRLAQAGRSVLVLDAGAVGSGVSGHTTAKVTAQHGLRYARLRRSKGEEGAAHYAAAQLEALEWIDDEVRTHHVGCDWERVPTHLFGSTQQDRDELEKEAEACSAAGLPATFAEESPTLPFGHRGVVRVEAQAQFHPGRWLGHLAAQVEAHGGVIAEGQRVLDVVDGGRTVVTRTHRVTATEVVIATHFPILDRGGWFARLEPERDLVISGPVDPARAPDAPYLGVSASRSLRTVPRPDGGVDLIVGGENYRTGAASDVMRRHQVLAQWASEHFGVEEITHRWSAHDLVTPDGVPCVGPYHPGASHLWVAAGFNLWGMTGGTAAGRLLADLILGRADRGRAALFDPQRVSLDQAPGLLRANAVVARHLTGDLVGAALTEVAPSDLSPGVARVGRVGTRIVAAYRDDEGVLHAVGGRCSHLGCVVAFNDAEKSWDCPCHGSRFDVDGAVLHGPAVEPLGGVDLAPPGRHQD